MSKQDLTLTEKLKPETVAGMLTRTAAHYPNSGHTAATLKIVAEDWFNTFSGRLTDRAFIEAVTTARRKGKFFPTETDVFEVAGLNPAHDCKKCIYEINGPCKNRTKPDFDEERCGSFKTTGSIWD